MARTETIQHLARQLSRVERRGGCPTGAMDRRGRRFTTGIAPLDALLPGGGFYPGALVEWLSPAAGSGAGTLLFRVAAHATQRQGNLIVIDPAGEFYPPAASRLGIELRRSVVVRPAGQRDTWWAFEQALRCPGVRVAICCLEQVNDRVFRRLQLAAEQGGGLGLLLRAARFRDQPSWADIRLSVTPLGTKPAPHAVADGPGRRLQLELLRYRGKGIGKGGGVWGESGKGDRGRIELELNDETGAVRLVAELAAPKVIRRATGA